MKKLLVCIDGSGYADNICQNAAWAAGQFETAEITLLHVLPRHSDYTPPSDDFTGSIGFRARTDLLEELAKTDEERGRLDQKKGNMILEHGIEILKGFGVNNVQTLHRRGDVTETIQEVEKDFDMIFLGKRGEQANRDSVFLGSTLEKTARAIHTPLFAVSAVVKPIEKFMIAYDGKNSIQNAIDYIVNEPLLKNLECHLVSIESHEDNIDTTETINKLTNAGYNVTSYTEQNVKTDDAISSYVIDQNIDLLVIGAYSHSRLHDMLLGSTTASLIKKCHIPLLMFR